MRAFSVAILLLFSFASFAAAEQLDVWFGTGGNNAGQPQGIWHATFDTESGNLSKAKLALELKGAGWITWHPTLPVIYSTGRANGKPAICSINVAEDKTLSIANSTNINHGSCFVTTDKTGSVLVSAQYGGGTVVSIPIGKDGMLGDEVQEIQHEGGSDTVPGRQKSPHPHYAEISPDNKFVFVPDLGLDQLVVYGLDIENQKLVATDKPVDCVKGGGPRHMKIRNVMSDADGKFAFVLNELAMSLSCFAVNDDGTMELLQTAPTLSDEEEAGGVFNSASEVRIHPGGKFIYAANRGHDSISVFEFSTEGAVLKKLHTVAVHGAWPRNFNLTPDGKWLLAAGAHTNSVTVFSIDQKTGKPTYQKKSTFVPGAICVSIQAMQEKKRTSVFIDKVANLTAADLGFQYYQSDPKSSEGFAIGKSNSTKTISETSEINGISIRMLEDQMRPGARGPMGSEKGFLGANEGLIEIMVHDNKFVVDEQQLSHVDLARPLLLLGYYAKKRGPQAKVEYGELSLRIQTTQFKGYQYSPFNDKTKTDTDVLITNLKTGDSLKYSLLVPHMIERYGFYEGMETSYRVEPSAIIKVLELEKK